MVTLSSPSRVRVAGVVSVAYYLMVSLSSPSRGGALYRRVGVSERRIGEPESKILPAVGCSHSHTRPRAWICGSRKTWLTELMGPHGMPAARSSYNHPAV